MDRKAALRGMYEGELLHRNVYRKFMRYERNAVLRGILARLSVMEGKHAELWSRIVDVGKVHRHDRKEDALVFIYRIVRLLFGLSMAIKLMEYRETQLYRKLDKSLAERAYNSHEKDVIRQIRDTEEHYETPLVNRLIEFSPILNNIRDVTFGMNDGLVEILAVTVGLGAALQSPFIVLIAGLIVAVSGALSMAGGAYLSTIYEKEVRVLQKRSFKEPLKSAFYVGVAYIIGAMVPLIPFMLGYQGALAIGVSLALTAMVISVVAFTIAVVTNVSIKRRVASTLAITLGIAAATILLGYFARVQFHISI